MSANQQLLILNIMSGVVATVLSAALIASTKWFYPRVFNRNTVRWFIGGGIAGATLTVMFFMIGRSFVDSDNNVSSAVDQDICEQQTVKYVINDFDRTRPEAEEYFWPRREEGNGGAVIPLIQPVEPSCSVLELVYDVPDPGSNAGWGVSLSGFFPDREGFNAERLRPSHLVFMVRGLRGGEMFDLRLKDMAGREVAVPIAEQTANLQATWQTVRIPLSRFSGVDLSKLDAVIISFPPNAGKGAIFIDHLAFD